MIWKFNKEKRKIEERKEEESLRARIEREELHKIEQKELQKKWKNEEQEIDIKSDKYITSFIKNFDVQHLEAIPVDFKQDILNRAEIVTNRLKNSSRWFSSGDLVYFQIGDLRFYSFQNINEAVRLILLILQTYPNLLSLKLLNSSETINFENIFKGYYELLNLLQENKIQNLHKILKDKENLSLGEEELIRRVIITSKKVKEASLVDKLNKIEGKDIKIIAGNVFNIFGENYEQEAEYICNFLNKKIKSDFKPYDLKKEIEDIKEKKKLSNFEEELFRNKEKSNRRIRLEDIDKLTGFEFETFSRTLFERLNYKVKETKKSGDQGADLIMEKDGELIAVQTKRYSKNKVGNKAIQEIVASLKYYNCKKGIVFTNSLFTKSARELALKNKIELIDRNKLKNLIEEYM